MKDKEFLWAKNVEKYVPTGEGYDYKRISAKETEKIIGEIKRIRKKFSMV